MNKHTLNYQINKFIYFNIKTNKYYDLFYNQNYSPNKIKSTYEN